MNRFFKYWISYYSYYWHHYLAAGQKWQTKPIQLTLVKVKLKNKKLAKELEKACQSSHGFLTYKEFLDISQFGNNGYYATHKYHGMTDSYLRWGTPIVKLCMDNKIHHVIEFGCGDGKLGIVTHRTAKEKKYDVSWTGIDIGKEEREKAEKYFQKEKLDKDQYQLVSHLAEVEIKNPCLAVFSYSLDSLSPELFTNTSNKKSFPNTMIGIKVTNGVLEEILLTKDQLKKKGIYFEKGIYTQNNQSFDLSSWQVFPNQRAFVAIDAFETIVTCAKQLPKNSIFLILDEMQPKILPWDTSTICAPKDLDRFDPNRAMKNEEQFCKTAGENLLYYPTFVSGYLSALKNIGCTDIQYNSEHLIASRNLEKMDELPTERFLCYMVLGKRTKQINKNLQIHFM